VHYNRRVALFFKSCPAVFIW